MPRYRALLLANWKYKKPYFTPLRGPQNDIRVIRDALTDPDVGLFKAADVEQADNLKSGPLGKRIAEFLKSVQPGDNLLIYYSGHGGLRGVDQYLALCGTDTTNVDAEAFDTHQLPLWIQQMGRAAPTILVLDCCFAGQSGTVKSAGLQLADKNVPTEGMFTLASSGMNTSPDSKEPDQPSPFTAALAAIIRDTNIPGSEPGVLTCFDAFNALRLALRDSQPHWGGTGQSAFPIAIRPVESQIDDLPGWRETHTETIDVEFSAAGVCGAWTNRKPVPYPLFDKNRQWAVHRLTQLIDGVVSRSDSAESFAAVRDAWRCVGVSLFETVLPGELRDRITKAPAPDVVLKIRFLFNDDCADLARLPWERLQEPGYEQQVALGLRDRVMFERYAAPFQFSSAPLKALVVNGYRGDLAAPGDRIGRKLQRRFTNDQVNYLGPGGTAATFRNLINHISGVGSEYLVLVVPLIRESRSKDASKIEIGFASPTTDSPDWRPAPELLKLLADNNKVFKATVLVTFAANPGRDTYRAGLELASKLARDARGPIAYLCHEMPYKEYLDGDPGADVFPDLFLGALSRDKAMDSAFTWARDTIVQAAGTNTTPSFGTPHLFAPPEAAGSAAAVSGLAPQQARADISTLQRSTRPARK